MEKGGALGISARIDTSEPQPSDFAAPTGEHVAYPPPPPRHGDGGGGGYGGGDASPPHRRGPSPPRDGESREEREARRKRDEIREVCWCGCV